MSECVTGTLSFNGQRCTALKILLVHKKILEPFLEKFSAAVGKLKPGLPWEPGVALTPLPEPGKPAYLKELVDDARPARAPRWSTRTAERSSARSSTRPSSRR